MTTQFYVGRFLVGTALVSMFYPCTQTFLTSVFSQVIAKEHSGTMLGLLLSGGALAKLSAPLWSSRLDIGLVFVVTCGCLVVNLVSLLISRNAIVQRMHAI
jgi:MFS family permease